MMGGEQRLHDVRFPGEPDAHRDARDASSCAEAPRRWTRSGASPRPAARWRATTHSPSGMPVRGRRGRSRSRSSSD
jgi:hypothetical protein